MPRSIALFLGLVLCAPLRAGSVPPVFESMDLTLVTLNRLRLEPVKTRSAGLLPLKSKELPNSVREYLRPSGQLDSLSGAVGKAAARIRRAVAPGRTQADALRDSRRVVQALGLWLDTHLSVDASPTAGAFSRPCEDLRLAYPRVSAILKDGQTDSDGRALAAVAILRALKVPARVATARGMLVVQYWVAAQAPARSASRRRPRSGKSARSAAPKPPLGWWECMDPGVSDAEIDAWSLDASSLARLRWKPKQEMELSLRGWERQAFGEGDSQAAHEAFAAALERGSLTDTPQALALSIAADSVLQNLTQGASSLWVLTAQHWRMKVEGVLNSMQSVQVLTPYRPDFGSWGREQRGAVRALDLEAEGVWSDRPKRLRLHTDLQDEWASPPPALGMLHWYDLGVRGAEDVLQAERTAAGVDGVVLRGDNLTPREGWTVTVSAEGTTFSAQTLVAADGHFKLPLEPALSTAACLDVSAGESGDAGDFQKLLLWPP
ncbi:MAG TPA: hypothetical protein VK914_03515 [bacterium]|jgi:hypothetical protein|nr:hypothetical protein [bacterium]